MTKYVPRFVTPGNIISEYKNKLIEKNRQKRNPRPGPGFDLDANQHVEAYLEKFTELGEEGWVYSGMAMHPDLPYGGLYVFYKEVDNVKKTDKVIEPKKIQIEKEEIDIDTFKTDGSGKEFVKQNFGEEVSEAEIEKNKAHAHARDKAEKEALYDEFEEKHDKKAFWQGKETQAFKEWLSKRELE